MPAPFLTVALIAAVALAVALSRALKRKNVDIILRGRRKPPRFDGIRHIFFCVADHFEPLWNSADAGTGRSRIERWVKRYPVRYAALRDGGGRPPQHTFFYPAEQYRPEHIDLLAGLVRGGWGDVEIHLHHDGDTAQGLRQKIVSFRDSLHDRHGLLRSDGTGVRYGFIHGNWALDDSGAGGRHCGVRNELSILSETGCYADFTYPSAPHRTQPPVINRLYYAAGDPGRGRSHHRGVDAAYRTDPAKDLLLVTGPLAINWRKRRKLIFPAIENGDITGLNPPDRGRIDLWVSTSVGVRDWPGWIFIKTHTHGAKESNAGVLLGDEMIAAHDYLLTHYNDGVRYVLHYVTAWELFQCVRAVETGDTERMRRIESFDYLPA